MRWCVASTDGDGLGVDRHGRKGDDELSGGSASNLWIIDDGLIDDDDDVQAAS